MNRALLISAALILSLALALPPQALAETQGQGSLILSLNRSVSLNRYGHFIVDDSFVMANNSTDTVDAVGFEVFFPKRNTSLLAANVEGDRFRISVEQVSDSLAKLSITPGGAVKVEGKGTLKLNVKTYLSGLVAYSKELKYVLLAPLAPNVNMPLANANVTFRPPSDARVTSGLKDFTKTESGAQESWSRSFAKLPAFDKKTDSLMVEMAAAAEAFTVLGYSDVRREVVVESASNMFIQDYFKVYNKGNGVVNSLKLLLDRPLKEVTFIPTYDPPLKNPHPVSLEDGAFGLKDVLGSSLKAGDALQIGIRYSAPASMKTVSGDRLELRVPGRLAVEGVAPKLTVEVKMPLGYDLSSGRQKMAVENASPQSRESLDATIQPKMAWASYDVLPAASVIFILALAALLMKRPAEEEAEEAKKALGILKVFEDKIVFVREALSRLGEKDLRALTRKDLDEVSRSLEEMRSRFTGRLGEFRSLIVSARPDLQPMVNEFVSKDRELDRAVQDLLGLYRQHLSGRVKTETFTRLTSGHYRRMDRFAGDIEADLNTLRRELGGV